MSERTASGSTDRNGTASYAEAMLNPWGGPGHDFIARCRAWLHHLFATDRRTRDRALRPAAA